MLLHVHFVLISQFLILILLNQYLPSPAFSLSSSTSSPFQMAAAENPRSFYGLLGLIHR